MIKRIVLVTMLYAIILSLPFAVPITSNATVAPGWLKHNIGAQTNPCYSYVKDIDGDGDLDVVSTTNIHPGLQPSEVAWWQNRLKEGQPWNKVIIRSRTDEGHVDGATGVIIDDIDNDGRQDIIVAAGQIGGMRGGVCWFKAPEDQTQGGTAWQRFNIDTTLTNTYVKVYTIDVNEDGWKDLIVSGIYGAVLFINPGTPDDPSAVWGKYPLPADTGVGLYLDDINEDGRTEVINTLQLYASGNVSWYDFRYEAGEIVYNRTMIADVLNYPFDVCSMRVNADTNHDVIVSAIYKNDPSEPGQIYWYEAPADITGTWIQHVINNNIGAADNYPGDIDGDGRNDFIVSVLWENRISWYKNELLNGEIVWSEHGLDDAISLPGDISLADMDGDGDLDVETSAVYGAEVVWYENKLNATTTTTIPSTTTMPPTTTTTTESTTTTSQQPTTTTTTELPTLVSLIDFNAIPGNSTVNLVWSTASEIDNAGFNIYRAESEDGEYVKINDFMIPAQGSSTEGAFYEFVDKAVRNRKTYYYKLEDIDLNGNSTMHDPVSARPRLIFGIFKK
jgi:hypothetical protein